MNRSAERLSGADPSPYLAEHRSRYRLACSFVRGQSVLDVACGTGYGAAMMLDAGATFVAGADASSDAVAATAAQAIPGLVAIRADATSLPFQDHSFQVVTSFETVEHLEDDGRFLDELRRVLTPEGVLLLSTPNALHTRPVAGKPTNRFHVREYTPQDLKELLVSRFARTELFGQRPHPHFRPCPYWERKEVWPQGASATLRVLVWKLLRRLPSGTGNALSLLVLGRPLLPGEGDFVFDPENVAAGHVILALCRG